MARIIGGLKPTTFLFADAVHNLPANQDPQSQTLDWGPEPAGGQRTRHLIIGYALVVAAGVTPNSVLVGGDAATPVVTQANAVAGAQMSTGIWIVEKPTGTSGTVAIGVPSGDIDGGAMAVWAAYNLASAVAVDVASDNDIAIGTSNLSLDTFAGGAVFAVAGVLTAGAISAFNWTGVTADSTDQVGNDWTWVASALGVPAATPRTVEASFVLSGNTRRIYSSVASFR